MSDADSDYSSAAKHSILQHKPRVSVDAGLALSEAFSDEQRSIALAIWPPLMRLLRPVLPDLIRLECSLAPNGLILESSRGWSVSLCCLVGERLPHFISVREQCQEAPAAIKLYLKDGSYRLKKEGEPSAALMQVMRNCLHCLGASLTDASGVSRRVSAPRRWQNN